MQLLCHDCNIAKGFEAAANMHKGPDGKSWLNSKYVNQRTCLDGLYVCENEHKQDQAQAHAGPGVPAKAGNQAKASLPVDELEAAKTRTATMRKNDKCEAPFNAWLNVMLDNGEAYTYEEYANAGAFNFECSQETIKRYLNKRLDLPGCNPATGDLTLRRKGPKDHLCVTWRDPERWYFK